MAPDLRYQVPVAALDRPLHVAILDSSPLYRALLSAMVRQQGWEETAHPTYAELVTAVEEGQVDLALLDYADVPAPEHEVGELCETVNGLTVIFSHDESKLKAALRAGATMAVQKPFDPDFLALSVEALLHRGLALRSLLSEIALIGDLRVHLASHVVEREGRRHVLSPTEWQLFAVLLSHPGRIFDRDELAEEAWGTGYAGRRTQIELYISRLRRKIERDARRPEVVQTVRHAGYRLGLRPTPVESAVLGDAEVDAASSKEEPTLPVVQGWIDVYGKLVALRTQMLQQARQLLAEAPAGAYRRVLHTDILLMRPEMSRLQRRLAFWEGIAAQMYESRRSSPQAG